MKKHRILLLIVAAMISPYLSSSQSQHFVIVNPQNITTVEEDDSINGIQNVYNYASLVQRKIGRADDAVFQRRFRTRYYFAIASFVPQGARVNSCSLYVTISGYDYNHGGDKAKIIKLPRDYSSAQQLYGQFTNPLSVYYTGRKYEETNGYLPSSSTLTADVQTAVSSANDLTIGILSENEGSDKSVTDVPFFYLRISYTPMVIVTVQNSFAGGTVQIDNLGNKPSPWTSPSSGSQIWYEGDAYTIRAYTQAIGNPPLTYPFPEPGNWSSTCEGSLQQPNNNTVLTIHPSSNCTYTALFGQPTIDLV